MSDLNPVSATRRVRLVRITKLLALLGLAFVSYPFIAGLLPDAGVDNTRLQQWHRDIDLSSVAVGELRIIDDWPGGPVALYHRSAHERDGLERVRPELLDADSPSLDSALADYFIFNPITGPRGCQVRAVPASKQPQPDILWYGGFIDPCSGALYDTAGRIYTRYRGAGQTNLTQPDYRRIGPGRIELRPPAGK